MTEIAAFFALNPEQFSKTIDTVGKDASKTLDAIIATNKAILSATGDAAKHLLDLNLSHAKSILQATTPYEALELQSAFAKTSFDACRAHAQKLVEIASESIEKATPNGEILAHPKVNRRA